MMIVPVVCIFSATIILTILDCFFKKNKAMNFLLQLFSLATLFCGGAALAYYKNNISLYSICLIFSILPQILGLINIKEIILNSKKFKKYQKNQENLQKNNEKTNIFEKFSQSSENILAALGILLTSIVLSVCGLVLGLETVYLYLLAIAIAAVLTFLILIIKKNINLFDLISYILVFLAVGLALAQILTVLIYSFEIKTILYCLGLLIFATYSICSVTLKKFNYSNLIYLLSIAVLFLTFIF